MCGRGVSKLGYNTEKYFYAKIASPQDLLMSGFVSQIFLVTRLIKGLSLNDVKLKRGKRVKDKESFTIKYSMEFLPRMYNSFYILHQNRIRKKSRDSN